MCVGFNFLQTIFQNASLFFVPGAFIMWGRWFGPPFPILSRQLRNWLSRAMAAVVALQLMAAWNSCREILGGVLEKQQAASWDWEIQQRPQQCELFRRIPGAWDCSTGGLTKRRQAKLGGGFKHFLFSPRKLGKMNPFWRAYFSNGLVQPPTS